MAAAIQPDPETLKQVVEVVLIGIVSHPAQSGNAFALGVTEQPALSRRRPFRRQPRWLIANYNPGGDRKALAGQPE